MDNIKKIGLSALAGSMVALSASAVEMSVSGSTEMSYVSEDGQTDTGAADHTGSPFGMNTSLSFSGSGETDWGTLSLTRTINDGLASSLSMFNKLDMGDAGVLSFDSKGGDLTGVGANDDKLPYAYEESWTHVGTGPVSGLSSNNVIGYSNTFGMVSVSGGFTKANGAGGNGDQGNTGGGNAGSASDIYVTIAANDNITVGAGYANIDNNSGVVNTEDTNQTVAQATFTSGPISVGYLTAHQSGGTTQGYGSQEHKAYSLAFNVNESFSVSAGKYDVTFDGDGDTGEVTESSKGFGAAYTMGSATLKASFNSVDDAAGTAGNEEDAMDIGLTFAF